MSTAPPPYAEKSPYQQGAVPIVQPIYAATMPIMVGTYPIQCTCPQCRMQIVTRVEKKNGLLVWLACGGLFIIGCWPCYFIPFCVDAVKDTEHYCPSCGAVIGVSKQI